MNTIDFLHEKVGGLVSIIMPTRNGDKYISSTIATIADQTYDRWELIVVEDGSRGATESIVSDFADNHPGKVQYLRNETSGGASFTRNKAFRNSRGEFIALLDSDDRWQPAHLRDCMKALLATGGDIVYSTVLMVDDATDKALGTWGPHPEELGNFPVSMIGKSFVTPSASVMRRSVLEDVGAWSTHHRYCEDYDFWLRCIEAGKTFHHLDGIYCLYRKNHEGATTQKISGLLEEVAMTTEHYIGRLGVNHKEYLRATSNTYKVAANVHRKADPAADPSADPRRSFGLLYKAWCLTPRRLSLLAQAYKYHVRVLLSRSTRVSSIAPPAPYPQTDAIDVPEKTDYRAAA